MAKNIINEIRKNTRRKFSADEKIRVVVEGLRGEISISELCRREKISPSQYYKWSKQFLEAGKNALTRETSRNATDGEESVDSLMRSLTRNVSAFHSNKLQLRVSSIESHLGALGGAAAVLDHCLNYNPKG